jgi:exosome complex RNA-binding protein Csl4
LGAKLDAKSSSLQIRQKGRIRGAKVHKMYEDKTNIAVYVLIQKELQRFIGLHNTANRTPTVFGFVSLRGRSMTMRKIQRVCEKKSRATKK